MNLTFKALFLCVFFWKKNAPHLELLWDNFVSENLQNKAANKRIIMFLYGPCVKKLKFFGLWQFKPQIRLA